MATADEIARWMIERIRSSRYGESQADLVYDIEANFGSEWVYDNDNGNPAISRKVLTEFRKLHAGSIEWERGERTWYVAES